MQTNDLNYHCWMIFKHAIAKDTRFTLRFDKIMFKLGEMSIFLHFILLLQNREHQFV